MGAAARSAAETTMADDHKSKLEVCIDSLATPPRDQSDQRLQGELPPVGCVCSIRSRRAIWPRWFARNVRHVCDGVLGRPSR